jgi:hypothetical protein
VVGQGVPFGDGAPHERRTLRGCDPVAHHAERGADPEPAEDIEEGGGVWRRAVVDGHGHDLSAPPCAADWLDEQHHGFTLPRQDIT